MTTYININNENQITVNNKTLVSSHWKPSELRPILTEFELSDKGSLPVLLKRFHKYIEEQLELDEKEAEQEIKDSDIIQKAVSVSLSIEEYVLANGLSICEFVNAESIIDFIDLHE